MQTKTYWRQLRTGLAVIAAGIVATGCLVSVQSDSRWQHGAAAMASMDNVQSGVTGRQWIFDHLGNPDSSYVNAKGNEVLRYISRRETEADIHLFLLFSIDVSEEEIYTVHIEIEDDVVNGWWIEP